MQRNDSWVLFLLKKHLWTANTKPAVRWMNRFAFLAFFVSVFAWVTVYSVMTGLQGERLENILKQRAHLMWEGNPEILKKEEKQKINQIVSQTQGKVDYLLQSEALLEIADDNQVGRVRGRGVLLRGEENLGKELVVGEELLYLLGLSPGQRVRLRSVWREDAIPLTQLVTSTFKTGVYEIDSSVVRVDKKRLESLLEISNAVSLVEVRLEDPQKSSEVAELLQAQTGRSFKTWQEIHASLLYSLKLEKIMMMMAMFFMLLLAAIAMNLSMSVRVVEKSREIALLEALGAQKSSVLRLYFFEGSILGALAAFFGLLFSWIFCYSLSHYIQLPSLYYSTSIPVTWSWGVNTLLLLVAVAIAALAAYFPSKHITKLPIQEALRS